MAENTYPCPCFSGKRYTECCELIHKGKTKVLDVEQVVRARYTAFCYGEIGYLIDTLHPRKRRLGDSFSLSKRIKKTRWIGLKIIGSEREDDIVSYVDFVAFRIEQGMIAQQHERSRFSFINDKWFYFDGEELPPIKLERNEPCFCGSGKKFKKCHETLPGKLEAM
ncbi:MAG: zinc chelation protein SecC [Piscirickettsiaceae bacterium]|jgi:SEC-C motif domain protein|nr:zinc chelation protein SecC [Piscirickettsiaceae bacterium]